MRAFRSITPTNQCFVPSSAHLRGISVPKTANKTSRRSTYNHRVIAADMFAKLKSMINDTTASSPSPATRRPLYFANDAPSWEELQSIVTQQQKDLNCEPQDLETGPFNRLASRRTFGKPGEPRVKLYHDSAIWCPYCEKVLLLLEEKQVPYITEKVNMRCYGDKPPEFMAKVPSGLLPVLELDGHIITESATIMELLEELYPERPMLPPEGSEERARAASLKRLERRLFSDWLQWLCNGWGGEGAKVQFIATMDQVEEALGRSSGPYFLNEFGQIDIIFAPFLERIVASIAYYKGFVVRGQGCWPNLERWFMAMESRQPYHAIQSDFYTHAHDLPPQLGGCVSEPASAPFQAAINGTDGKAWHLPLPPLNANSLEPYSLGEDPARDRLKAAAKLVGNHENVAKFALRGAGKPGPRRVSAPLADPTAIPALEYLPEVDAALRHAARALLQGGGESCEAIKVADSEANTLMSGAPVVPSLEYLRDRVGVPRDLPLPAARQLRAHLNWVIDSITSA